jgi:hypothetical protein
LETIVGVARFTSKLALPLTVQPASASLNVAVAVSVPGASAIP